MIKNPPANEGDEEMGVPSLSWEDPLEKEMEITPVFLPGESHGERNPVFLVNFIIIKTLYYIINNTTTNYLLLIIAKY